MFVNIHIGVIVLHFRIWNSLRLLSKESTQVKWGGEGCYCLVGSLSVLLLYFAEGWTPCTCWGSMDGRTQRRCLISSWSVCPTTRSINQIKTETQVSLLHPARDGDESVSNSQTQWLLQRLNGTGTKLSFISLGRFRATTSALFWPPLPPPPFLLLWVGLLFHKLHKCFIFFS